MNTTNCTSSEGKRESQIIGVTNKLFSELSFLEDSLNKLNERLSSILQPDCSEDPEMVAKEPKPYVPLASDINNYAHSRFGEFYEPKKPLQ